ncbi:MAG: hypothetical protein WAM75_17310, partial [Xanthobacteraceae bacterium]
MILARTIMLPMMLALASITPARANFTSAQLAQIAATPPPHAVLPQTLIFKDENGRHVTVKEAIGG